MKNYLTLKTGLATNITRLSIIYPELSQKVILNLLSKRFELDTDSLETLLEDARARSDKAIDLHSFTSVLKQSLEQSDQVALIEMLWEVIYADGILEGAGEGRLRSVKLANILGEDGASPEKQACVLCVVHRSHLHE